MLCFAVSGTLSVQRAAVKLELPRWPCVAAAFVCVQSPAIAETGVCVEAFKESIVSNTPVSLEVNAEYDIL